MNKILIIAGGNFPDIETANNLIKDSDLIIAADRGFDLLYEMDIKPDFLIGDLDSVKTELDKIKGVEVLKYPPEKNYTDFEIAINKAIELKPKEVIVLGGTGTRLDHTIINILILRKLYDNNIKGKIIDKNNEIIVSKGEIEVNKSSYKYLSIIPLEKAVISISGVKYPLVDEKVNFGDSLCISNEIVEDIAKINVSEFSIIFQSND